MMRKIFLVLISFFLAALLTVWPISHTLIYYWPEWLILVLIYWSITLPGSVSVGFAFFIGLLLDLLRGTLLGEHALLLVLITFFIGKFYLRIRLFPIWQQMFTVFALILAYELTRFWLQSFMGLGIISGLYYLSALTSALVWPIIYVLLNRLQPRQRFIKY